MKDDSDRDPVSSLPVLRQWDTDSCCGSRQTLTSPSDSVLCLMRIARAGFLSDTNTLSDGVVNLCPTTVPGSGSGPLKGKCDREGKGEGEGEGEGRRLLPVKWDSNPRPLDPQAQCLSSSANPTTKWSPANGRRNRLHKY